MNKENSDQFVKVWFPLIQDEDGYPPFSTESVWAIKTEVSDQFIIDSIPFYARLVSSGDIVEAKNLENDIFEYKKHIKYSGHSTVRVIVFTKPELEEIRDKIKDFGCDTEVHLSSSLIAVDIPGLEILTKLRK